MKSQDEAIFDDSGNRVSEVRRIRESLLQRRKLNRASVFMRIELDLVQQPDTRASVAASLALCSAMEQTRQKPLLFEAARLGRQVSGIIANTAPQLGESVLQHSMEILLYTFPQAETHYPGIFFDQTIKLVRDSPTTEDEKFQKYMDLSNQAKERMDCTRANQALLAALDAAKADLQQCKMLPSVHAALQRLQDWHTTYIEFHQHSGMAFFESAGISGYLPILSMHSKDNFRILQIVEDFQSKYVSFGIPLHQERMFNSAAAAAEKLALTDQSEQYNKKRYKWLRQCPFSDQEGRVTKSALSDPDYYLRQISHDPIVAGVNALQLVLYWAKTELEQGLLTAGALSELFSFIQADWQKNDCDLLVRLTEDLDDENDADESVESFADRVARCLYGVPDKPTPSAAFLEAMQRLVDWLHLQGRPPTQAARLGTAKFIMLSRLHRQRLYMACRGFLSDTDVSDHSEEQKMLEMIEALELAARGGFVDQSRIQTSQRIQTTLDKCYVPGAVYKRLISDEELRARISDCEGLALEYANSGRNLLQYQALLLQSRLQWQQYILFKTVPPDACLEVLEKAESLFNNTRRQLLTPSAADRISATISLTEDFRAQSHSQMALVASFMSISFLEESTSPPAVQVQDQTDTGSYQVISPTYDRFLGWTHRLKGRGLIDLIYFDADIVQDLAAISGNDAAKRETSKVESELSSSVENLNMADTTLQKRFEQAKPSISKVTPKLLSKDLIDDRVVSKTMIDKMLRDVGDNVVLVDFINISYLRNGHLQAVLYRKGVIGALVPLPDMTLKAVETWVGDNLGTREKYVERPLSSEGHASEVEKLTSLLTPLFNPEMPHGIKGEETIIFCLTGALHRIPVHAIPIHGKPLIESHPVAYCQNLTILYRSYEAVNNFQPPIAGIKSLAIMPSYKKTWRTGPQAEEELQQQIGGIFNNFGTTSYTGPTLSQEKVQSALSDCGHFFYYGHVRYEPESPSQSALLLNQAAHTNRSLKQPGAEGLTVRDLFKVQLHRPALATLIGCGSGRALTSGLDDILGFPTALLFAGASAIVSTLWSIDSDDGARFAVAFYDAIRRQQTDSEKEGMSGDRKSGLSYCVNLARAMHEAVKMLRQRGEGKNAAYHWAAFYLTGFWLFPELAMNVNE